MKDNKKPTGDNFLEQMINEFAQSSERVIEKGIKLLTGELNQKVESFFKGRGNGQRPLKVNNKFLTNLENIDGVLGYSLSSKRYIHFDETEWGAHTLVTGATGAGKTSFILLCAEGMMNKGKSVVLIDPKGDVENLKTYRVIAREKKAKLHIFQLGYEGEDKVKLNPFKHRRKIECMDMLESVLKKTGDNPFYFEHQMDLMRVIVDEIYAKGEWVSLPKLRKIFNERHKDDEKCLGMVNKLNNLVNDEIIDLLEGDDAKSIDEIIDNGECLYIGINIQILGNNARILAKLFSMSITKFSGYRQSYTEGRDKAKVATVIFDEAGSVIESSFLDLISKSRSSKIEIVILAQSFNDLSQAWPDKFSGEKSLSGNAANYIAFRQEDDSFIQWFAGIAGTIKSDKKTQQINDGLRTGGESVREVDEYLVHPNVIRNLKVGQAVVINKRKHAPMLVELVQFRNIEQDPRYSTKNEKLKIKGLINYKELNENKRNDLIKEKQLKKFLGEGFSEDSFNKKMAILGAGHSKEKSAHAELILNKNTDRAHNGEFNEQR